MSGMTSEQQASVNEEEAVYDEIEEDTRNANGSIYNKFYEAGEKFAGTYIGQYVTGKIDKLLKLIEDTAKWSLPQSNDKNESREPLERPLPWIPFIAMILVLRFARLSLSIAGLLIGSAPILPSDVVYFIQTQRRKLRAIRITGMRDIRNKEQARIQNSSGLLSKLRSILSVVVCTPGKQATNSLQNRITREASNIKTYEADTVEKPMCYKRKAADESFSDHDLTLDQILDKYGNASSDDDSDFKAPQNMSNKDSSSSESTSSVTSDDNDDEEDEEMQQTSDTITLLEPSHNDDNKKPQFPSKDNENESSGILKENGERIDKQSCKPVPMPKPKKQSPVPLPMHEIKQEPTDNDEEREGPQEQCSNEYKTSPNKLNLEQKSAVALKYNCINTSDTNRDQYPSQNQITNMNGGQHTQIDHKSEEVFLTPATSNEDLFFSPVGSPILGCNFGFQPTSILKNSNAVYPETRGPVVENHERNIRTQEMGNDHHITSKLENAPPQNNRTGNYCGGRANKNKLRGKRR